MHRLLATFVLPGLLVLSGNTALAQQPFDGRWSIQATPEKGACKRARLYAATIQNGTIRSAASRGTHTSGGLDPGGRVQGSVVRNKTKVDITGSLSGRTGSGSWVIAGRVNCSGRWSAEKH
jgi:hypothetical protein